MPPTFAEFCSVLDGTGHQRGWKRDAYKVYCAGQREIFYPQVYGYYKYLVDGERGYVARSVHRDSDAGKFVEHQRFTFE